MKDLVYIFFKHISLGVLFILGILSLIHCEDFIDFIHHFGWFLALWWAHITFKVYEEFKN